MIHGYHPRPDDDGTEHVPMRMPQRTGADAEGVASGVPGPHHNGVTVPPLILNTSGYRFRVNRPIFGPGVRELI